MNLLKKSEKLLLLFFDKNSKNPLVIVGREGGRSGQAVFLIQCAGEYVQQELPQKNSVYCCRL